VPRYGLPQLSWLLMIDESDWFECRQLLLKHDANWPDWYAEYIVAEQAGKPLPS
jgi:hypothetical protein